ncbi:MAG TPA: hypothetical protein DHU96_12635, partial [Actinobacteria bacterium]|nr:hypothetical protein [Actinomycetota bacterium]
TDVAPEDASLAARAARAAASCGGESFTAGTKILLASGIAVPIASLKVSDKVLATNIRTGKTRAEPVAAVLVHHDTDRYDLKIRDHGKTSVIGTTSSHLFWVSGTGGHRGGWVKAGALRYGTHLRTPSGSDGATALGGWIPEQRDGWMWDITVPGGGDHDFYIDVIHTAVLVHNCPMESKPLPKWKQCIVSVMTALHIVQGGISAGTIGRPPVAETKYEYRANENPTGAPPEPENGGGGGEGEC